MIRQSPSKSLRIALDDVSAAIGNRHIAAIFGWQDIIQRYRRSKLGAFWITINMAVLVLALGTIFGTLFRQPINEFIPHLTIGLIFWSFISTTVLENMTAFITAKDIILQMRAPFALHVFQVYWRNSIILGHNLLIVPIMLLVFLKNPGWPALLLPVGYLIISINVLWMGLLLATICTRYRDLPMIVQNALQVIFYLTPIMWTPQILAGTGMESIIFFNPFYHLLTLVQDPLLGQVPSWTSYLFVAAMTVLGWLVALFMFGRYRSRIAYWL